LDLCSVGGECLIQYCNINQFWTLGKNFEINIDEVASQIWGLIPIELKEIQESWAELK
jgi:hypothetical protein